MQSIQRFETSCISLVQGWYRIDWIKWYLITLHDRYTNNILSSYIAWLTIDRFGKLFMFRKQSIWTWFTMDNVHRSRFAFILFVFLPTFIGWFCYQNVAPIVSFQKILRYTLKIIFLQEAHSSRHSTFNKSTIMNLSFFTIILLSLYVSLSIQGLIYSLDLFRNLS